MGASLRVIRGRRRPPGGKVANRLRIVVDVMFRRSRGIVFRTAGSRSWGGPFEAIGGTRFSEVTSMIAISMTNKSCRLVTFVGLCFACAIGFLPRSASALETANVLMDIDAMTILHQGLFRNATPNDGSQTFS